MNIKTASAYALLALGVLHIVMGLVRFKQPFLAAMNDGVLNSFKVDDSRRLAFWFTFVGPVLMLCGHLAVRAAAVDDLPTLGLIGAYLFATAVLGVVAFPASPLWALLIVSAMLIAVGRAWLS
jgi:hypothetical protein